MDTTSHAPDGLPLVFAVAVISGLGCLALAFALLVQGRHAEATGAALLTTGLFVVARQTRVLNETA